MRSLSLRSLARRCLLCQVKKWIPNAKASRPWQRSPIRKIINLRRCSSFISERALFFCCVYHLITRLPLSICTLMSQGAQAQNAGVENWPGIFSMRRMQRTDSSTAEQLRLETRMMGASHLVIPEPTTPSVDKVESASGISAEVTFLSPLACVSISDYVATSFCEFTFNCELTGVILCSQLLDLGWYF